jgi:phosphoglycerate dehydrogenase-like enzyme
LENLVALEPRQFAPYVEAIESSGAKLSALGPDVTALVWTDYARPDLLEKALDENPQLRWVQLPFAGVDVFSEIIKRPLTFTSAKRSYSEPVAEHALMLMMALGRVLPKRVKATSWGKKHADSLYDENILIVGGGGIAQELVRLLAPFRSQVTVVRKHPTEAFDEFGIAKVVGFSELDRALAEAKFVVVACALTDETRRLFNLERFKKMRPDSHLVNVARGEIVDQDELLAALDGGLISGAALDVTYPEPLEDGHPLFGREDLIITPHTADTMQIVQGLFSARLRENVTKYFAREKLVGEVDPQLGY